MVALGGSYYAGAPGQLSATGANPSIPSMALQNLERHWGSGAKSDHSEQYPGFTREDYSRRALELVRMATDENISGYRAQNGAIVRYDRRTNDYVKGYRTGVATLFKPDDCERYFQRAMQRESEGAEL